MHLPANGRKRKVCMNRTKRRTPEMCAEADRCLGNAAVPLAQDEIPVALLDNYRDLLRWAAAAGRAPLPPSVRRRVAELLVDELAALAAGLDDPDVGRLQESFLRSVQGAAAHALTAKGPVPADPIDAAAAHAVAINWMELDEGYLRASCHGALYTLPPLLALAEADDVSLDEVLDLFAVAYEVTARLAETWPAARFTRHPHADWSAVGAAVARCLWLGHDAAMLQRAVDMAATLMLSGTYAAALSGARVRNLWAPAGIQLGMQVTVWAAMGIEGPAGGLPQLMSRMHDRAGEARHLTNGLGERWCVAATFNKPHACCQSLHTAIDAALELRAGLAHAGDWPDGVAITVETPRLETAIAEPCNRLQAQFSMPHAVAAALVLGHADPPAFAPEALGDERITRLRERVVLEAWPAALAMPAAKPARIRLQLPGGALLQAEAHEARGTAAAPLSPADILAKLERHAADRPGLAKLGRRLLEAPTSGVSWRALWRAALGLEPAGVPT